MDVVSAPPEMGPITKDPGNERIRFCKTISEFFSAQLQKLAENEEKKIVQTKSFVGN